MYGAKVKIQETCLICRRVQQSKVGKTRKKVDIGVVAGGIKHVINYN
jgi:hypothetical protein